MTRSLAATRERECLSRRLISISGAARTARLMEQGAAAAAARIPRVLPKSAWINDKDVPECQGPDCTLLFSAVKRR